MLYLSLVAYLQKSCSHTYCYMCLFQTLIMIGAVCWLEIEIKVWVMIHHSKYSPTVVSLTSQSALYESVHTLVAVTTQGDTCIRSS